MQPVRFEFNPVPGVAEQSKARAMHFFPYHVLSPNRKMSDFIHDTITKVETLQYPQDHPLLGNLDLAEGQGCFSYTHLTNEDGYLFLDNLTHALAARCSAVAAGLIIRGLPVSQQNLDLAIEMELRDVILAIVQRAVPLDATSIIFCINYACQNNDDELIHTIFERQDVTSDHLRYVLQQLSLQGRQEEAQYLLQQIRRSPRQVPFKPFFPPPLHRACLAGDWKRVQELLVGLSKEEMQTVWSLTGQTAVELAAAFELDVVVNELIVAHADQTFRVGNTDFRVNRALLASRSDVFRKLFDTFNEKGLSIIEIKDTPSHEFGKLLEYLYTGKLEVTSDNFACFALLANRYSITGVYEFLQKWLDEHPEDKKRLDEAEPPKADGPQDPEEMAVFEIKEQLQGLEHLPILFRHFPVYISFETSEEPSDTSESEAELLEKLATNKYVSREELSLACQKDWRVAISFAMQNSYAKRYDLASDLYQAIDRRSFGIAKLLIVGGVNFEAYRGGSDNDTTVLHLAVLKTSLELVSLILEKVSPKNKRDFIDAKRKLDHMEEDTGPVGAIDLACESYEDEKINEKIVQLLRAEDAKPNPDRLFNVLCTNGFKGLKKFLECFSQDERKVIVNMQHGHSRTALHLVLDEALAHDGGYNYYSGSMNTDFALIKLIIHSGADLSIKDQDGRNPVEYALHLADQNISNSILLGLFLRSLPYETRQQVSDLIASKPSSIAEDSKVSDESDEH